MRETAAESLQVAGRVVEGMPGALYRVALRTESRALVTAHVSGSSGILRVLAGDEVLVELFPYDLTRGRIVAKREG